MLRHEEEQVSLRSLKNLRDLLADRSFEIELYDRRGGYSSSPKNDIPPPPPHLVLRIQELGKNKTFLKERAEELDLANIDMGDDESNP